MDYVEKDVLKFAVYVNQIKNVLKKISFINVNWKMMLCYIKLNVDIYLKYMEWIIILTVKKIFKCLLVLIAKVF